MQEIEEARISVRPSETHLEGLDNIGASEESSGVPEYEGPPRVIVLVKPPAYEKFKNGVQNDLEANGFEILSTRDYTFTEEEAREYYSELASLSWFETLISIMISGPSYVIMACRNVCIQNHNLI